MGWGLGLAQVRAVAEAHGGSIGVDSVPERGTTFTIEIPLDARPYQSNPITPTAVTHPLEQWPLVSIIETGYRSCPRELLNTAA
jgi:Histidine kinase-, DNA gyrase B-, and HSP90-like ATPase